MKVKVSQMVGDSVESSRLDHVSVKGLEGSHACYKFVFVINRK